MTGPLVAVVVVLLLAGAVVAMSHGSASTFCNATGVGSTAGAAVASYRRVCGSDYAIAKGPYDADKATTPYASYAQLVEYSLQVKDDDEGSLAFLEVGQRTTGSSWRTLSTPGTGP